MQVFKVFSPLIHLILIALTFSSCKKQLYKQSHEFVMYEIRDSSALANRSDVDTLINFYKSPISVAMNEQVGYIMKPALKGLPEGSLGNFITDLIRNEIIESNNLQVDACILNTGGLRVEWQEGPVLLSQVYEMMPFDNELVIVSVSAADLKKLLDQLASRGGAPVSGVRFVIEENQAVDIYVGSNAFNNEEIYRVLTSDYLLQGGDKYAFPQETEQIQLNRKVRDVIKEALSKAYNSNTPLIPSTDGRIQKR